MVTDDFFAECNLWAEHPCFVGTKKFKGGRESVRDDERCGKGREVRTPELVGKIRTFVDEDRRVSIETISEQFEVSVGTVHNIVHDELNMRKICAKFVPRVLSDEQKERHVSDSREMVELINSDPRVLMVLVTCDESWIYCYELKTKSQSFQWKHLGTPRPKARQSKVTLKRMMIPFFDNKSMIYILWVPSGQTVNKEYYVEVLREFRKRFRCKSQHCSNRVGGISTRKCTRPQLYPCFQLFDEMGIKTVHHPPYSPDLAPCDFWLFSKLKDNLSGSRFETIEEMKEVVTRVTDTFTPEDFQGAFQKLLE
ncbi:histone-lysine N-methyltransferase SETMAR-like [Penaeus monodon]|uniref:histone-lysine N-methyltransferase SETMAR-like n=1 Tax=Penaeus monodon TaxID=6687 RepID=UPI0018A7D2E7|nr:histone-lysine N-methyltransferase SETMAR-like [Penaeus monodon]